MSIVCLFSRFTDTYPITSQDDKVVFSRDMPLSDFRDRDQSILFDTIVSERSWHSQTRCFCVWLPYHFSLPRIIIFYGSISFWRKGWIISADWNCLLTKHLITPPCLRLCFFSTSWKSAWDRTGKIAGWYWSWFCCLMFFPFHWAFLEPFFCPEFLPIACSSGILAESEESGVW